MKILMTAVIVLVATAGSVASQELSLKQARGELAQAAKAAVKEHAQSVAWRFTILKQELADIEQQLADDALDELAPVDVAEAIAAAWREYFNTLTHYGYVAQTSLESAAHEILARIAPTPEIIPRDFGVGDDGILDGARAAQERTLRRAHIKADKLRKAFSARLAKHHGLACNMVLGTFGPPSIAPSLEGGSVLTPPFALRIEILVAVSDPDVLGDGALVVCGMASGEDPVIVQRLHPLGNATIVGVEVDEGHRFTTSFWDLPEDGNKIMVHEGDSLVVGAITVP